MTDIAASQPPGLVSALGEASLQKVREAMSTPNPTVTQARVDISNPNIEPLARALPPGTGITELLDTMRHLAILPPTMRLCIPDTGASRNIGISPPRIITSDSPAEPALPRTEDVSTAIDSITRSLPISERLVFALAPVRWRDPFSKAAAFAYFRAYERQMHVGVQDDLKGLELLEALEEVRGYMKRMSKSRIISGKSKTPEWPLTVRMSQEALAELEEVTLQRLESLHATLVVYMWLSYRLPLGFYQSHEAEQLKAEVERGIEWCLEQIKTGRTRRQPFKYSGSVVERLTAERKPEAKIQYLTRDAIEQWRSQGSTPAVWEQLVKNKPRQATG
ncbi:RNA helicase [Ceratobasidium sp. UAMH 11750]|nr:RNA helicase [Ceratobasidium sp. UAMH 11750]